MMVVTMPLFVTAQASEEKNQEQVREQTEKRAKGTTVRQPHWMVR